MNEPFQVRVFGTENLMAKLNTLESFHRSPKLRALLEDGGEAYVILARRDAPKNTRMLVAAMHHEVRNFGTPLVQLRIGFDERASRWAQYVEFGSNSSIRRPRLKKYMHWFSAGHGGKTIQQPYGLKGQDAYYSNFRRVVRHPGNKAIPFFLKHLPFIRDRLLNGMVRILNEEMNRSGSDSSR